MLKQLYKQALDLEKWYSAQQVLLSRELLLPLVVHMDFPIVMGYG